MLVFIFWNQTIWPKRLVYILEPNNLAQEAKPIRYNINPNPKSANPNSIFWVWKPSLSHSLSVSQLLSCGAATRPHLAPRLLPCSVDDLVLRHGAAPTQPSTENGLPNLLLRRAIIRHRSIATLTNWYGASLSLSLLKVFYFPLHLHRYRKGNKKHFFGFRIWGKFICLDCLFVLCSLFVED